VYVITYLSLGALDYPEKKLKQKSFLIDGDLFI